VTQIANGTFGLFDTVTMERTISLGQFLLYVFCITVYCAIWIHRHRMKLGCGIAVITGLVAETAHQTLFDMALMPALAVTGGRRDHRVRIGHFRPVSDQDDSDRYREHTTRRCELSRNVQHCRLPYPMPYS
jgi:hypothetical protein